MRVVWCQTGFLYGKHNHRYTSALMSEAAAHTYVTIFTGQTNSGRDSKLYLFMRSCVDVAKIPANPSYNLILKRVLNTLALACTIFVFITRNYVERSCLVGNTPRNTGLIIFFAG